MNKTIKILHTEWSDGWGGQEIRIINEMLAVREQGIDVYLACREHSHIGLKAQQLDIPVFFLPFRGNLDITTLWKLIKVIKQHHIDILNSHSGRDTWVGGFAAKLSGIKFIRTRHLSNNINASRLNFINELADYIFTTGESVKENMIKYNRISPSKIMSIPTGIDEDIFDPSKYDKEVCRELFNLKPQEFVIGILAVLRDFKRHDVFLDIAKQLINNYSTVKFKFIIAGEGPKRKAIEQQIIDLELSPYVIMIGHTDKVAEFLKAINLFVLPSDKNEGVPQSLIQALMMETPSVSTTAGSIQDLLHQNNFLISSPELEKIYNNIKIIIEHATPFIQHNREYIVKHFSQSTITHKIINIYHQLLHK